MVAAGWCHDVLEDTDVTFEQIENILGVDVANLVQEVTNTSRNSKASRQERKRIDREHIANISREAKLLKLADRIDNLRDMEKANYNFLRLYLMESQLLLDEALRGVDEVFEEEYEKAMRYLELILGLRENGE